MQASSNGSAAPAIGSDALAWVLGVPDSRDFVAERLGRSWLHAPTDRPGRFADLLSLAHLDEVLGTFGLKHPSIRLVQAEQDVPTSEYVWRDGLVDPAQVARLFAGGATVIFGGLHDRHEGMRRLCSAVTRQVCARSQTNIYLTPPDAQGFKPHWDTHDVYVLQIEGSKRWRIYSGGPERPLEDQKFDPKNDQPGDVEAEFTLSAGEALYIPRGIMHAAVTTDETSLHVTLGLMAYTWSHLLVDCLSEIAGRSAAWRANVPFGFAHMPEEALADQLASMVERLRSDMDVGTVAAERQRAFEATFRPRVTDGLRQALRAPSLGTSDVIRWRPGAGGRIERRNGRVALVGVPREVELPAAAAPTLEILLRGEPVRAGDLGDGLDWASRRVVLTTLIREGFVAAQPDLSGGHA